MRTAAPPSTGRYRRRIIVLGAAAFVVVFVIGALIFIPVVQTDLEDRLGEQLANDGVEGVSISFSGQDGTLECDEPLSDPEAVRERAENLHGVRKVTLDSSCTSADAVVETSPPATDPVATGAPVTEPPVTDAPATTTAVTQAPLDSLADIISDDPLFGQLEGVLETSGLLGLEGIGGRGPFTVLAPTDAAFDAAFEALGADAFEALTSDPELLRVVLLHHVADGEVRAADFEAGPLTMLDGSDVEVDPETFTFTSGNSVATVADPATQLDIEASNGVLHAIDALLVPPGLDLSVVAGSTTEASLADGQITLTGVVSSAEQRDTLVAAAEQVVDPGNIVDALTVDEDTAVADGDVERLANLIENMPPNLLAGDATLQAGELTLVGVYLNDEGNAAITAVATSIDADVDVNARDVADAASAAALQDELNAFVATNPILFEQSSIQLTDEANAVIEQVAARALRLDGISITIVGHTDTDGDANNNQLLSEGRAATVLQALVDQGLPAATLTSEGEGESSPILDDDGVEDKAASRRVEFFVTATSPDS